MKISGKYIEKVSMGFSYPPNPKIRERVSLYTLRIIFFQKNILIIYQPIYYFSLMILSW